MDSILSSNMPQDNPSHAKRCTKCQLWLPFSKFSRNKNNKDGLEYWCLKCCRKNRKETTTPEITRNRNYRRLYNISAKQYDRMFVDQGGVCAICKQSETARSRTGEIKQLAVDHDHVTDEVRRLLCQACNLTLGVIETNFDRLDDFLGYLEEMKKMEPSIKVIQLKLVD